MVAQGGGWGNGGGGDGGIDGDGSGGGGDANGGDGSNGDGADFAANCRTVVPAAQTIKKCLPKTKNGLHPAMYRWHGVANAATVGYAIGNDGDDDGIDGGNDGDEVAADCRAIRNTVLAAQAFSTPLFKIEQTLY